jgi:hypothetical protein
VSECASARLSVSLCACPVHLAGLNLIRITISLIEFDTKKRDVMAWKMQVNEAS